VRATTTTAADHDHQPRRLPSDPSRRPPLRRRPVYVEPVDRTAGDGAAHDAAACRRPGPAG